MQLAPPKSKYIEHILVATRSGEAGVGEIFRTLQFRLRDSTWTIVFKSLIVLHLMIREGAENATLEYLADNPRKVAISSFSEGKSGRDRGGSAYVTVLTSVQFKRKDIISGDIRITLSLAPKHLPIPRSTMYEAGKAD